MIEKIKQLADYYEPEFIKNRRHLHAHPELSFKEFKTARYIFNQLESYGLKPQTGIAGTGLVALIKGKNPDKQQLALRADIDALPILESNDVIYKSKNKGLMHACGHDVHTACLLGAAQLLSQLSDEFEGAVKLIFQPGEELFPGGASLMIKEKVLQNPVPKAIIGQHVMPYIPTGKVGFREGLYMASADELYITIKGKGGHGAMPEYFIDPVLISAHVIVALQQIVSRSNPRIPSVLSIGKVLAEGATNIIPNEVYIEGTFRTLDEDFRNKAHEQIKNIILNTVKGMGGTCDIDLKIGYPCLINNPELTRNSRKAAELYLGKSQIIDLDIWMGAEDFSYYTQKLDACFYRLGTGSKLKKTTYGVHTPHFNIDEDALKIGAGLMAWEAFYNLQNYG